MKNVLFITALVVSASALGQDYVDPYADPFARDENELREESIDTDSSDPFTREDSEEGQGEYQDPFEYIDPFAENIDNTPQTPQQVRDTFRQMQENDERSVERGVDNPFTFGIDEREFRDVYDDPFTEGYDESVRGDEPVNTFSGDIYDYIR